MKRVSVFDRPAFGRAVSAAMRARTLSVRTLHREFPHISTACVSRAVNGKPLATENVLALALALNIDLYGHFSVQDQAVTAPVSRETGGLRGIADRLREARQGPAADGRP